MDRCFETGANKRTSLISIDWFDSCTTEGAARVQSSRFRVWSKYNLRITCVLRATHAASIGLLDSLAITAELGRDWFAKQVLAHAQLRTCGDANPRPAGVVRGSFGVTILDVAIEIRVPQSQVAGFVADTDGGRDAVPGPRRVQRVAGAEPEQKPRGRTRPRENGRSTGRLYGAQANHRTSWLFKGTTATTVNAEAAKRLSRAGNPLRLIDAVRRLCMAGDACRRATELRVNLRARGLHDRFNESRSSRPPNCRNRARAPGGAGGRTSGNRANPTCFSPIPSCASTIARV